MKRFLSFLLAFFLLAVTTSSSLAAQGLTLLHSPLVAASVQFLGVWNAASPVPGPVVSDQTSAVALVPTFQGYPCVVYEDAQGQRHALFNPPDMATVTAWRSTIDNPPKPTSLPLGEFLLRFTDAELVGIQVASASDPAIQVLIWRANTTPNGMIDLGNQKVIDGVNYAASKGYGGLTMSRAVQILTP